MDDVGTFDRFARFYDLAMMEADSEALGRGLARAERDLDRVIDLAGGTGRGLEAVQAIRSIDGEPLVLEGIVLDAARGMLERARKRGHATVQGDASRLPLAEDAVDAVIVVDAFHHLPNKDDVCAELGRVLAPGGVVVVQEFDPSTIRGRVVSAGEHLVGFDSEFDTPGDLCGRLERAGLDPTAVDAGFSYVVAGVA